MKKEVKKTKENKHPKLHSVNIVVGDRSGKILSPVYQKSHLIFASPDKVWASGKPVTTREHRSSLMTFRDL